MVDPEDTEFTRVADVLRELVAAHVLGRIIGIDVYATYVGDQGEKVLAIRSSAPSATPVGDNMARAYPSCADPSDGGARA